MSKQHAFLNTQPDLFTPPYSGYINTYNGEIYKSPDKHFIKLTPTKHIENIIHTSDYFTDWCYDEEKVLPYQLEDILIQPNEVVHAHVINDTFKKIYTNLEYLLSRCKFYTNTIPTKYVGWFGCAVNVVYDTNGNATYNVDSTYKYHTPDKPCYQYFPCQYASLSGIKSQDDFINYQLGETDANGNFMFKGFELDPVNGVYPTGQNSDTPLSAYSHSQMTTYDNIHDAISFNTVNGVKYTIFISKTALTFQEFYSLNAEEYIMEEDTLVRIDDADGLPFKNITSVSLSESNNLFIYDAFYNTIFQFDLKYLINNDAIIDQVPYVNAIGGDDKANAHLYKFETLKFIKCSGKYLFAYDENEGSIIVYDEFLNFQSHISNNGVINHKPVSITYRVLQDEYYILCEDGVIFVFTSDFIVKEQITLTDSNKHDYISIAASSCDSNVYYIALKDSMLQKLFSNHKTIGKFTFGKLQITNDTFKWWSTHSVPWNKTEDLWIGTYNFPMYMDKFEIQTLNVKELNSVDDIWLFANNGRLIWLQNNLQQVSLLQNYTEIPFTKNDLKISEDSYVQSLTYNTIIKKFIDMFITIANTIVNVPVYTYDANGELVFDKLVNVKSQTSLNTLLKDLKIYDNDILSTDVINRVLTGLFTIEQELLQITSIQIEGTKYNKNTTITIEL